MQDYLLPENGGRNFSIPKIHAQIPTKVGFDIFDYEMLFNDEKTQTLIRTGNTIGCFYINRLECAHFSKDLIVIHLKCLQQQVLLFALVLQKAE